MIREIQDNYTRAWMSALLAVGLGILWLSAVIAASAFSEAGLAGRTATMLQAVFGWGALGTAGISALQFAYLWAYLRMLTGNGSKRYR